MGLSLVTAVELLAVVFDDTKADEIVDQSGNTGKAKGEQRF